MPSRFDDSILRSLRRITRAIDLHSRHLANIHKLTGPQLVCLRHLARHGTTTPSKLARSVALSQATITGILDRLERRKLITRERDKKDRRRVNLALTKEGRDLLIDAPMPLHQTFANQLAELPEEQQERIDSVLREIVEMMEAEDLEAAPVLSAGLMTAEANDVAAFLSSEERKEDDPSS
jgi:DNA-binding MarR family transcriptional regulator